MTATGDFIENVGEEGGESSVSPIEWMERAACRIAPSTLFITPDGVEDPPYPPPAALFYCNRCPVRRECLDWALTEKVTLGDGTTTDVAGVWGGMTEYQRRQLKRPQSRSRCPGCSSDYLVEEYQYEICLACGVSWPLMKEA